MKRIIGIFAVLGVFCLFISLVKPVQADVEKKELKEQMRLKLKYSQEVLEGMVLEDLEKVEKAADNLVAMCQVVGWTEEKTKGQFKTHDTEFHEIARELSTLAKAGNLEGVQNKYNHMIMTCIDCHQHIRDVEAPEKYKGGVHEGEYLYKGQHIHSR